MQPSSTAFLGIVAAACVAAAVVAPPTNGQVLPQVHQRVNAALSLSDSTLFDLNLDAVPGEAFMASIPIEGSWYTVDAFPFSVRADGFKVFHQVEGGALVEVDPGPVATLRGSVQGEPGSLVAGGLLDDGLHLMIDIPGKGRFWVQPAGPGAGNPATHAVYGDDDVIPSGGTCGNDQMEVEGLPEPEGGIAGICGLYVADLAIDADLYYFQDWGAGTQNRIQSVINTMNVQYSNQVDITHLITAIIIRTSEAEDPYNGCGFNCDSGSLLTQFRTHWIANHGNIPRDVAHLFTGRNLSGGIIGIAWDIGAICSNGAYALAESDCCGSFGCATDLSAHELGHLWGCFHCSCPTSTMNPSLTCANSFNAGSIASIIGHRDSIPCLQCSVVNDACNSATAIQANTSVSFTSINATTDGFDEAAMCNFNGYTNVGNDVWYRYSSQCDGTATVTLCSSAYNTKLAVYEFGLICPQGPNEAIACNDNACGTNGNRSQLTFPVSDNAFYRFRIGGFQGATGNGTLEFTVECAPVCPSDTNGDGAVDVQDLTAIIVAWGTDDPVADVNDDGIVDVQDLTQLIIEWGDC